MPITDTSFSSERMKHFKVIRQQLESKKQLLINYYHDFLSLMKHNPS